jgi:hypothetical protein
VCSTSGMSTNDTNTNTNTYNHSTEAEATRRRAWTQPTRYIGTNNGNPTPGITLNAPSGLGDMVSAEEVDGMWQVTMWTANGNRCTVAKFDREDDARYLAVRVRQTLTSWKV